MSYLNQEIQSHLDIYSRNNQRYTRCLIRKTEIVIDGKPEEIVRQIFLHYLIKADRLLADKIYIKVEANNHDIEIYRRGENPSFQPHQSPLIIVEIKRESAILQNHYNQIKRYLTNARCDTGVLYNYHQTVLFNKVGDDFQNKCLGNFKDIEETILAKSNDIDCNLLEFEKAQKGDFGSFADLVKKYGKYTTNTIVFKIKSQLLEIKGCFFKLKANKMYYDLCGQFADNQQVFDIQDFEKLVSITY
jgi:Type I restriction enzyme R protein N terminus (HSDR_N)